MVTLLLGEALCSQAATAANNKNKPNKFLIPRAIDNILQ
jgi:hypothetical protein